MVRAISRTASFGKSLSGVGLQRVADVGSIHVASFCSAPESNSGDIHVIINVIG